MAKISIPVEYSTVVIKLFCILTKLFCFLRIVLPTFVQMFK